MNIAVRYYSKSGRTQAIAQASKVDEKISEAEEFGKAMISR